MAKAESVVVPPEIVEATIQAFTDLDESGDKRTMNKMARRLGKEQPALLQYAAKARADHGDPAGEAAVFYGTLVWAIFDRHQGKCPRLTPDNLSAAAEIVAESRGKIEDIEKRTLLEQTTDDLVERQPHIYAKLTELLAEDMRFAELSDQVERGADFDAVKKVLTNDGGEPIEDFKELVTQLDEGADFDAIKKMITKKVESDAITLETATAIFEPTQSIIEAFDAAIEGRRPGQRLGPIVREQPKVGRNEPCPCGSGKKYKKCCGKN